MPVRRHKILTREDLAYEINVVFGKSSGFDGNQAGEPYSAVCCAWEDCASGVQWPEYNFLKDVYVYLTYI